MNYLFVGVLSIVAVEALLRSPAREQFDGLLTTANKTRKLLASKTISDHWKERAMLCYAWRILIHSLALGALAVGLLAILVVPLGVVDLASDSSVVELEFLWRWEAVLTSVLAASVYIALRGRRTRRPPRVAYTWRPDTPP